MLSFELKGGLDAAERLLGRLTLPVVAPSLGGVETLITRPATTSHAGMAPADRLRLGITDGLVRLSVGIEATDDLLSDFDRALQQ
jgi:cystathionine beta-lyase/cystathionine gamma-synthase